ncbi:Aromatic amino acid exporter YddG [Curvibacter sp. AEP1-3]|uniref:DMT family transporter n=1 Tax=Curvibacter sp. AEP1-3 TaxID=1844971 RepID=UPI000B3BE08C|nr:DMT family transporter [Curvibacter sp. AEP1-3]ARV19194.1 Aromatic amino acid exporter YddG [Curvibacter sp. AEP1-3]
MNASLLALAAIALWGSLAPLGVSLGHVPPFLLTGVGLVIGSVIGLVLSRGRVSEWKVPAATLALGVYGLFGFHFLLFIALRHAPPVQANLVNYLWPLGIVLMAPLFLPGMRLRALHVAAALLGFAGAALAILGGRHAGSDMGGWAWGYLPAMVSAFVWASYSLMTRRVPPFPNAAIGLFGLVSGMLSLLCHALLEPSVTLSAHDWQLLAALGLGPLGGAFYLWDAALKRGDARTIGVLSFLTPLLSTLGLLWIRGEWPSASVALAAAMIVGAAVLGSRAKP